MNHLGHDNGGGRKRRPGTLMIVFGWALVMVLLMLFFNRLLERQENPNTVQALESQQGSVVLEANRNGMYVAGGYINGIEVEFLLDTGATVVAVPLGVARDAGMELGPRVRLSTAGGVAFGWTSQIDTLELGNILITDVAAVVYDSRLGEVLLGMNALKGLDFRQSAGVLELRPSG